MRGFVQSGQQTTSAARKSRVRVEIIFANAFNAIGAVQPLREKYPYFLFSEIMIVCCHPASSRGALRAIVTTRGAGMRWTFGLHETNAGQRT
jgi:hypothetical protein